VVSLRHFCLASAQVHGTEFLHGRQESTSDSGGGAVVAHNFQQLARATMKGMLA
jgi:hypothetical protein